MPTREEMIAALSGGASPSPKAPSREEMIAALSQSKASQRQHDLETLPGTQTLPTETEMLDAQGKAFKKLLGYPVGLISTGLAAATSLGKQAAGPALKEIARGNYKSAWSELGKNIVSGQEVKHALNPFDPTPATSTAEFADRLGIPKGSSVSDVAPSIYSEPGSGGLTHFRGPEKGGPLDPTVRGTAITLGEMAVDPMNYLLPKPIRGGLEATGKGMYRSGLKAADIAAEKVGKGTNAASDLLFREGVTGTPSQIASKSSDIAAKLLEQRNALMERAGQLGARPDMKAALSQAESVLQKMKMSGDPATRELIPTLEAKLAEYKTISPIDLKAQSQWKTSLYNSLPQSAWDNATKTNPGREFQKTLARGMKEDIENQANNIGTVGRNPNMPVPITENPMLGNQIRDKNADLGVLLATQKTLGNEAAKSIKKNALTSVDPMVFALGHGSGIGLPTLAAKKTADVLKGSYARTKLGKGIYKLGELPLDNYIRQENVWRSLLNSENQGEE